jgi:hypothetical protein
LNDTPTDISGGFPEAPAPLSADTRGSTFELRSYEIDPGDQSLADEIANFDPVFDTKGPTSFSGSVRLPDSIRATGLPPHLRDPIMAQLANVPVDRREAEEQRLVNAALYENSLGLRIAGGPGEGANSYQRAKLGLTFDIEEAEREFIRLSTELAEVERWDNVFDERAGEAKPIAVERVRGQRRAAMEAQRAQLSRKLDQLNGLEGERRLQKALYEAVQERKSLQAQLDEDSEARTRADELLREERVSERAALYAKSKRTSR